MKRKLIKQGGGGGLTIYVPKKWINKIGLKAGDEVDVDEENNKLVIESKKKKQRLETTVKLPISEQSIIRRVIVNLYRQGYDKITIKFEDKKALKTIKKTVETGIIGFDIKSRSDKDCVIESITEPSIENFNTIINKEFFILKEIIRILETNITKRKRQEFKEAEELAISVHKYANFLRRCISKGLFSTKLAPIYWLFLSNITLAVRNLGFLNDHVYRNKIKMNSDIRKLLKASKEQLDKLHSLYVTKDLNIVKDIHNIETTYAFKFGIKSLDSKKDNEKPVIHYLINTIRMFYHCSSALIGIIKS